MKRALIAALGALSVMLAVQAFAAEGVQPATGEASPFEQMKAYHLKKIDDRLTSLQQEKTCTQAATNQDELRNCRVKHKTEMKKHHGQMGKGKGAGGGSPMMQ